MTFVHFLGDDAHNILTFHDYIDKYVDFDSEVYRKSSIHTTVVTNLLKIGHCKLENL